MSTYIRVYVFVRLGHTALLFSASGALFYRLVSKNNVCCVASHVMPISIFSTSPIQGEMFTSLSEVPLQQWGD